MSRRNEASSSVSRPPQAPEVLEYRDAGGASPHAAKLLMMLGQAETAMSSVWLGAEPVGRTAAQHGMRGLRVAGSAHG
jgi:hypothetical protein